MYAWMPTRMPPHIPSHESAPAHLGVHISIHMDVPLGVRMGMDQGVSPSVCMDVHLGVGLGICQGVHMDASLGVHWGVHWGAHMDTSLPSHPDVPTCRYPPADLHPGTFGHMHGEAPIRPSMEMGPRIKGSVPSPHYRYTDIYTRKDRHMCGHIGKKGRSHRKKGGDRHMGARTVLWIWGCTWSYVCIGGSTPSPPILGKNGGVYPYGWVGGWKKWGPGLEKSGGDPEKPPPNGENGGWTVEGGEKSPLACLGITRESRIATEPVGTRLGRGMGLPPSHMLPSPYGTLKRFLEALWNILKPLDVHTPLPTHPCVHVETATYPCLGP